jgi:uncharacterized protein YqjF (DUF2071 family)
VSSHPGRAMPPPGGQGRTRRELRELPRRQAASLREVAHRPWPLPRGPWVMGQSWCDLLFAHWAVDPELLEPFVPAPLRLEQHGGRAWLGITPFVLRGLHARFVPPVPRLSSFCEVNVRTYVSCEGKPGILFLTLEASSVAAVAGGRLFAGLPYRKARISCRRRGPWIEYSSEREDFRLRGRWSPQARWFSARAGSLEHFLVERYCLYATRGSTLWRAEVHHGPWSLSEPADGTELHVALRRPELALDRPPLLHVAGRQDVVCWAPMPVARLRHTHDS